MIVKPILLQGEPLYEFAKKLEGHYQESLQYVHPEARRIARVPGAVRAEAFFLDCYKSMGIEPQQ